MQSGKLIGNLNQIILLSKIQNDIPPSFDFEHFKRTYSESESKKEDGCILRDLDITLKITRNLTVTLWVKSILLEYCISNEGLEEIIVFISTILEPYLDCLPTFSPFAVTNINYSISIGEHIPGLKLVHKRDPQIIEEIKKSSVFDIFDDENTISLKYHGKVMARLNKKSLVFVSKSLNDIMGFQSFLIDFFEGW